MHDYEELMNLSREEFRRFVVKMLIKILEELKTSKKPHHEDGWMDTQEILLSHKIGRSTLYNWIKEKIVICKKIGGKNYYKVKDFYEKKRVQLRDTK